MVRGSRPSKKGQLWHGYRRPIRRDGAFWLAVLVAIVALAAQNAWSGLNDTTAWVLFGADLVVTVVITVALVGVLAGTVRGFGEGWRTAERPSVPLRPTAASEPGAEADAPDEPAAPPTSARPKPEPIPEAERPVIGVELEKKARALGRAIGATQRRARKP